MLGGNEQTGGTEEDYFRSLSPIDQLKLKRELANKREYSPSEAQANLQKTLEGLAYSTPVVANAMSIRDAYEAKDRAGKTDDPVEKKQAEAESAMAALSAFLPFSIGKPSAGSASRFGVFAGPSAKTADRAALAKAKEMAKAGASRDEIWRETGWRWSNEGKWKFEIDDSAMRVNLPPAGQPAYRDITRYVDHPELYEAYPQLRDIDFRPDTLGSGASFSGSFSSGVPPSIRVAPGDTVQNRSFMAHELQHAIQDIEGFSPGANPQFGHKLDDVKVAARQAYEESADDNAILRELGLNVLDSPPLKPWDELTSRQQLEWYDRGRQRLYYRAAGEQESRNVENRLSMSLAERRARPPWETQDIPDEQQIFSTERPTRQDVFVPVREGKTATRARNMFDRVADEVDPQEANRRVWRETNTFFGPEGTLLREIRDNPNMKIKGTFAPGKSYRMDDVIEHPELFNEFPEFKDLRVRFLDRPTDPRADRYTGSDPRTGEILIDESFQGDDLRVQLAKMLQYRINEKTGRVNAAREGPNTKIADANTAIENTRQAIADGIIPEAEGQAFIRSLQGVLDEGKAVRSTSRVEPGSYAESKGYTPGEELVHKQRRKLESRFWTDRSAGKQEIKEVKSRAYLPERSSEFPYKRTAGKMAESAVIPQPGMKGAQLAEFIRNWQRYGQGRARSNAK